MTAQLDFPLSAPHFDGRTYDHELDHGRLTKQMARVRELMCDGRWRTLAEIGAVCGDPEASVSARLRDCRKPKFGGYDVMRRRRGDAPRGLWEYRVERSVKTERGQ